MGKLLVASVAETEFTEALTWYAERSNRAAEGFNAEFDRALQAIGSDPLRFPLCDPRHRFYLMNRYPYQIIYRDHGDDWIVIAVAHTKRQPEYWSGR
jgi:plasmid stabilization system protein ParE